MLSESRQEQIVKNNNNNNNELNYLVMSFLQPLSESVLSFANEGITLEDP